MKRGIRGPGEGYQGTLVAILACWQYDSRVRTVLAGDFGGKALVRKSLNQAMKQASVVPEACYIFHDQIHSLERIFIR
jgi:hypothetical protein